MKLAFFAVDCMTLLAVSFLACSWRGRMQSALHNHWFHVVIVCLVALDALIVLFELLLDVGAFGEHTLSH